MKILAFLLLSSIISYSQMFEGLSLSKGDVYIDAGIGGGYTIPLGDLNAQSNNGYSINGNVQAIVNERSGYELELGFQSWELITPNNSPQQFMDNYTARFNYKYYWDNEGDYQNFIGSGASFNNFAYLIGPRLNNEIGDIGRPETVDNSFGLHLFFGVSSHINDYIGTDIIISYNRIFTDNTTNFIAIDIKAKYFF